MQCSQTPDIAVNQNNGPPSTDFLPRIPSPGAYENRRRFVAVASATDSKPLFLKDLR